MQVYGLKRKKNKGGRENPQNKTNCVLGNQSTALTQREDEVLDQHKSEKSLERQRAAGHLLESEMVGPRQG